MKECPNERKQKSSLKDHTVLNHMIIKKATKKATGLSFFNISVSVSDLDPDPGGQKLPTKIEIINKKFYVLKYWMFSFEMEFLIKK
jgi:hypothetical protein